MLIQVFPINIFRHVIDGQRLYDHIAAGKVNDSK